MTTTYSGRGAALALKRQASEGTAETSPTFEIPVGDGAVVGPEITEEDAPYTYDSQDSLASIVTKNSGIVDAPVPALPQSSVAIWQAVLGSRSTGAAVGGVYPHTLTPADTEPLYTWWGLQPGANYHRVGDTKLDQLECRWQAGGIVELGFSGEGKLTPTRAGSKWSAATVTETLFPHFTAINMSVKFEASTTPATTVTHDVQSGVIRVGRNLQPVQTDGLTNSFLAEGMRDIGVDLNGVVMQDQSLINTIFYGSSSGTTAKTTPVYGSIIIRFLNSNQDAEATSSMTITLPKVEWRMDRVPGASTSGDVVTYDVSGKAYKPDSGAIITVLIQNSVAGTTY